MTAIGWFVTSSVTLGSVRMHGRAILRAVPGAARASAPCCAGMCEEMATDPVFRLRAVEEIFFGAARDVGVPRAEAEGLLHRAQRAIVFGESRETNPYVLAYEWLPVRTGYQARSRN